ncbi:uncharacterized protein, partial [Rhodnius prolixus]|uniref:uncharacterized protein n=1 Tax=Rhodnius prolixus TaxID=13249 RepID=UPI003D18E07F
RHSYKQYNSTSSQTDIVDLVEQVDAVIEYNDSTVQHPAPTYTWQRSASCKELRKPGDADETEKAIIIPKYERNFIVAGSKTPSFDRTAIEQDKVYSSSYPGTTSSLSTESADEIEPGGSVLVIDTGSSREFSHDDLSHDSYELLERESRNFVHSRSCSIGSSGEGLPDDEIFVMDDLKDVVEKRLGYVEPRYSMDFNEFNEKCKQGIAKFRERSNADFNEYDGRYKPLVGYDEPSPHYPVERTKSEPFVSDFWRVARQHRRLFHQKSFDYTPAESIDVDDRGGNSKSAADIPYTLHKRQQMNGTAAPCFESRSPVSPRRSFEKQPTPETEKKKILKTHDKLYKTKHDSELNSQDSGLSLSLGAESIDEMDDPSSRNIFNFKIEKKPSKDEFTKHRMIPIKKDLLKVSSEDGPRHRGLLVKTKALSADSGLRKASSFERTPPVEVIKIDSQDGEGIVICSSDDKNISLDTSDPDVIIVEYHSKRKRAFQKRSASDGKRVGSLDSQKTDSEIRRGKMKDWKSESTGSSIEVPERSEFKRERFSKELKTSIEGKVVRETREEREMKKQRSEELQKQKNEEFLRKQQSEELQKSKCEELRRQRSALQRPKPEDGLEKTKSEILLEKSKEETQQKFKAEELSPKPKVDEASQKMKTEERGETSNRQVVEASIEIRKSQERTESNQKLIEEKQKPDSLSKQDQSSEKIRKFDNRADSGEKIQVFHGEEHQRKKNEYQLRQKAEDLYKIQKDDSNMREKEQKGKNEQEVVKKADQKPMVPPKKIDLLRFSAENKLKAKEKPDVHRAIQKQEKVVFEVSVEVNNSSTDMTYCTCEHEVPEIPEIIPEENEKSETIEEPPKKVDQTAKKLMEEGEKEVAEEANKGDKQSGVKQITSPEVVWKKFGELPPIVNKRERSPILFARLGFSEGSAFIPTHTQSPASSRRAKSLETPVVSLHRLPPITSFSSKDDTVDNDEGIELEEKTLKTIKPLHREKVIEEEDASSLSPVVTGIQFKSDSIVDSIVPIPGISEILEKEEVDKLVEEAIELQQSSARLDENAVIHTRTETIVDDRIIPTVPSIEISETDSLPEEEDEEVPQPQPIVTTEKKIIFPIVPTVEIEESSDLSGSSDENQGFGEDRENVDVVPVVPEPSRLGDEQKVPELKPHEYQDSSEPSIICDEEDDSFENNDVFESNEPSVTEAREANKPKKLPHLEPEEFFVEKQAREKLEQETREKLEKEGKENVEKHVEIAQKETKLDADEIVKSKEQIVTEESRQKEEEEEIEEVAKEEEIEEVAKEEEQPERRPSTRQERLDSFKNTKSYSVEIWTSEETDVPNVPTIDIEEVDWENDDDAFLADPIAALKEQTSPKDKSFPNVNVIETKDCSQITIESSFDNLNDMQDMNEISDANEGSESKAADIDSSNENVSTESSEPPFQYKEDINTLSALCEKIDEPAHLDLKYIPAKRSFDDDVSSSSSIKPDKTSTWKPFSLESSGSSSLEEGIFPPDDCSHFADEEEGSSNSAKDEYQGFGYSNAGAELIIGGYTGGIFGLSRTLSRISERSTTSEQERSDFDDDISTKPSSRSLSVEDESLLSSDRQPSLSSDPSTNPEIEEQPLPPLPPEPLGFKIPPPLLHNEEEWPSPPNSSFDTPIISSVETYYMELKPEEATKVVLPRDSRQYDSSSDSDYENKTLQEDDAPDSSTTLESTVKLMLKPKRQGNSSDTSIGVSDFSSSTSTVKHCQYYSTCTVKSDDSSLAEFGSSLSTEMLASSRKNSDDSISLRRRSYHAQQRSFDDYDSPYSESDEGSKQQPNRRSYGANLPSPTGSTGGRKCSSGKVERRGTCKGICSKSIARAKCYSYYSLTRSPPSDGSSSSLEMGEPPTTPNTIPRVSKRRRHVPPNKRRHRLSADVDTRDGHLISVSSPSVVAAAAKRQPQQTLGTPTIRGQMSKQSSV